MLHQNSPDADSLVISGIQVVGTDTDGDTATHTFTGVTVLDDAPSLSAQSIQINHTVGHYSGNYTFADGADDSAPPSAFGTGSLEWTNKPSDINFAQTGENQYTATFVNGGATYFIITVKNDGTYDFNLVTPPANTEESSGQLFSSLVPTDLDGNGSTEAAVAAASNFDGAFALVLTGSENDGATYGGATLIQKSSVDLGVNGNSIQESQNERVKFDVVQQPGFENATLETMTIQISSTGSISTGDRVDLHVVFKDLSDSTVVVNYDNSGELFFDIPSGKVVDYVELIPVTKNVTLKVTGIEVTFVTNVAPDDDKLDFTLTAHDGDGDTATAGFSVNVMAGTAGNDTLFTGNGADSVSGGAGDDSISTAGGNDILIGGEGHDSLIGGAGSDTYVFTGSLSASNSDTVTGFTLLPVASGGDVLNLHDVLPGAAQGQTTEGALSAYVIVTSGTNTTISVDADGAGGTPAVLVVTLQGVNTTLAELLNNNQIVT
jgi:Ca2+-binding RTX toxin-like protein